MDNEQSRAEFERIATSAGLNVTRWGFGYRNDHASAAWLFYRELVEQQQAQPVQAASEQCREAFAILLSESQVACGSGTHSERVEARRKIMADFDSKPTNAQPVQQPTYSSTQATNCAGCGKYKHTPLRIDAMGGYVCLTCIDQQLGSLLGEFGYAQPVQQPSKKELLSRLEQETEKLTVAVDAALGHVDAQQEPVQKPCSDKFGCPCPKHYQLADAQQEQDSQDTKAIALLNRLKSSLEHVRRFSPDTLQNWRRVCVQTEGDIEEFLLDQAQGKRNG